MRVYNFSDGYSCKGDLSPFEVKMIEYKHGPVIETHGLGTTVIAISGHAQNGKDTCAQIFEDGFKKMNKKVKIIHYADLLKFMCKNYFGWDGNKDDAGRTLLQRVGTDVVRTQRPDFWVDFVFDLLHLFPNEWDFVIIPDTRFPNEVSGGSKRGDLDVVHVRVTRTTPGWVSPLTEEQQHHKSETALDDVTPDYLIENDTLENTRNQVLELCKKFVKMYKED